MESVLINEPVDGVVRIDQLDRETMNMDGLIKGRHGKGLDHSVEPVQRGSGKRRRGDTRHLDPSIRKEFNVYLLPGIRRVLLVLVLVPTIRYTTTDDDGGLVKERFVGNLTMRENILIGPSLNTWTIFNLEYTLIRIPEGDHVRPKRVKDGTELNRCAPVSRNDHGRDAERCLLEVHDGNRIALKWLRLDMIFQFYL